jgi:hypothetical protein
LSYQWRFNTTNLVGATNATLLLASAQLTNAGIYTVLVSNVVNSILSSNAVLTVNTPSCDPPPAGLVSWWAAKGNALDQVGGNNGTLVGNTSYGPGEAGQGFVFTGNDGDGVVLGNPTNLQLQNFSIEAWVKRASTSSVSQSAPNAELFSYGLNGYAFGLWSDGRLYLSKMGIDNVTLSTGISDTNWHHVAVSKNGSTVMFYIDGTAYNVGPYASTFVFTTLAAIGTTGDNLQTSFYGAIDELSVYNRALSPAEIQSIYNAGSAGKCAPATTVCVTPPSGLMAWWRAESNALDSIGPNNGTLVGGTSYAPGKVGQAFNFSAAGDAVSAPTSGFPTGTSDRTIECWVYLNSFISGAESFIAGYGNFGGTGGQAYAMGVYPDQRLYFSQWGSGIFGPVLNTNQWYHVAVTSGGTNSITLYLNGTNVASGSLSFDTPAGSQLFIGGISAPFNTRQMVGLIDEVSIYNRTLTPAEIQSIYNAGSAGKCVDTTPPATVTLLNVDFSAGTATTEKGKAAAGISTNDFWNFYTRDDGAGGWKTFGSLTNLQNADGTVSAVGLTVSDAPGAWHDGSTDVMLDLYIYPFDGGNVTVTITNLPAGQYDVLPYSCNGNYDVSSGGISYGTNTCYGLPVVNPPTWTEGVQYTRFTNVLVNAGQPLVITAHPGMGDAAQISGLQIALSSLTDALPPPTGAPSITSQPTNQTVFAGQTASFSVSASGTTPLSYQWRFNTTNIVRATNATLLLPSAQFTNAGTYSVSVSNVASSTLSSNALLTVNPLPPCDPPPSGLVSWWTAEGNALDQIGGNNGTLVGNVSYGSGEVGQAFQFNSLNQAVTIPNAPALNPTNGLSMEAWVQMTGYPTSAGVIVAGKDSYNLQRQYLISLQSGTNGQWNFSPWIGFTYFNGATVVQTNTWYHVAMTYDNTTLRLYVNGNLDGSMALPGPVPTTTDTFLIGGNGQSAWTLMGRVDEVSLYQRALSGSEIQSIYIAGSGGKCFTPMPPVITSQPTSQTVFVGQPASFSVSASGTPPLSYQWRFNTTNIVGATNTTLILPSAQFTNAGNYTVLVSNVVNSILSSNALLTVKDILDHFTWGQIPSPRFMNAPFTVVIQARGTTNGLFTNFTGTVFLGSTNGIPIDPPVSASFVQGSWTGVVTVSRLATNLVMRADDGIGQSGLANPINILSLPALGFASSGNFLLIFWPVASSNFVLETSAALSPAQWVQVASPPLQIGDQYLESMQMNRSNQFFRLRFTGH